MVTTRQIRDFGRKLAKEFKPRRIILFGSHAYGKPGPDSDVDVLVIMPFEGRSVDKSVEIRMRIPVSFPLDLLIRTPKTIRQRLAMGDMFMKEVLTRGKVLYESRHR